MTFDLDRGGAEMLKRPYLFLPRRHIVAESFPQDTISQAGSVLEGWKKIEIGLKLGPLEQVTLQADLAQAQAIQTEFDALEAQYTELRNKRDVLHAGIWDKVKRVRASIKGMYGDDSNEYELVGGTRKSERKPPVRRTKAAATPE